MNFETLEFEELDRIRNRLMILGGVVILIFSLLASRLWYLQIIEGQKYTEFSQGNRIRLVPEPALRGIIYDRNGVILAENRPAYQLHLIREDTPDLEITLGNVSQALSLSYPALKEKIVENHGLAQFKPIILEEDLDYEKAMYLETFQDDFPGVSIVVQPRRFYPYNNLAAHLIGYVGIVQEDWKELPEEKRSSSQIVGHSGIELLENDRMIGLDGGWQAEVDHMGRELQVLGKPVPSVPGENISLNLDIRLQKVATEAMQGESGAVIVMNPKTGEILALASFPDFDPNLFSGGIDQKSWNSLLANPEHPLENKAIQGLYAPGSIFKVVTAYAGLDLGVLTPETERVCNGYYFIKGRSDPFKCWKEGGHGSMNLEQAVAQSCNIYFYTIVQRLTLDEWAVACKTFAFGELTGIDLSSEAKGIVPNSSYMNKLYGRWGWSKGHLLNLSLGQGELVVTPLQMVQYINILAMKGKAPRLHVVEGAITKEKSINYYSQKTWNRMEKFMQNVITSVYGTGKRANPNITGLTIAGKTGTAQNPHGEPHAWFVGYGEKNNELVSVIVLIENGGHGGEAAAPIAGRVFKFLFSTKENMKLAFTS